MLGSRLTQSLLVDFAKHGEIAGLHIYTEESMVVSFPLHDVCDSATLACTVSTHSIETVERAALSGSSRARVVRGILVSTAQCLLTLAINY